MIAHVVTSLGKNTLFIIYDEERGLRMKLKGSATIELTKADGRTYKGDNA